MDWRAVEDHEVSLDQAFTVIHNPPPISQSNRARSSRGTSEIYHQLHDARCKLLLRSYPPAFKNESERSRLLRADNSKRCINHMEKRIKDALNSMDGSVFEQLTQFIHQKHSRISSDPTIPADSSTSLPAALVLAGGVNSSDHAGTFAALAKALNSQQHCYTATLNPSLFGRSAADAFNSVFSQFSGRENDVPGITQVLNWYQQETGIYFDRQDADYEQQHPDAQASKRQRRLSLPLEPTGLESTHPGTAAAGGSNNNNNINTTERDAGVGTTTQPAATTRELRNKRLTPEEEAARCRANRRRPLVIIVENTEGVNALCFADFLRVLHRLRHRLPITLVVGLTTTARALKSMMPDELFDKLDCKAFRLTSAIARLDNVVQKVLLGGNGAWPGLVFGDKVMESLYNMFMIHCFSAGIVVLGLKVAVAAHFRGNAASCFAVVEYKDNGERQNFIGKEDKASLALGIGIEHTDRNTGGTSTGTLAHVYNTMPPAAAAHLTKLFLGGAATSRTTSVVETIDEAKLAFSAWSVAVQWLSEAAACVGLFKGYSHWELYRDAMHPAFVKNAEGKQRLNALHNRLKILDQDGVVQLAQALLQIAECTYRGVESRPVQVAKLKQFASLQSKEQKRVSIGGEAEGEEDKTSARRDDDKGKEPAEGEEAMATAVGPSSTAPLGKEASNNELTVPVAVQPAGRDRFFSKKSRTAALLAKAGTATTINTAGGGGGANNEGNMARQGSISNLQQQQQQKQKQSQVSPGTKFAYWLVPMLTNAFQEPPSAAPGSIAFYCKESAILDRLDATPKDTVYHALTDSKAYLGSGREIHNTITSNNNYSTRAKEDAGHQDQQQQDGSRHQHHGFSAAEEDAALAFQLFDQDPDCANVADWFQSFAAVHDRKIEEVQKKNLKNKTKEKKKGRKKGGRKGNNNDDGDEEEEEEVEEEEDEEEVKEQEKILAARFSQAAAELQLVGLIKPVKKRRGDFVVRAVHMPSLDAGL